MSFIYLYSVTGLPPSVSPPPPHSTPVIFFHALPLPFPVFSPTSTPLSVFTLLFLPTLVRQSLSVVVQGLFYHSLPHFASPLFHFCLYYSSTSASSHYFHYHLSYHHLLVNLLVSLKILTPLTVSLGHVTLSFQVVVVHRESPDNANM